MTLFQRLVLRGLLILIGSQYVTLKRDDQTWEQYEAERDEHWRTVKYPAIAAFERDANAALATGETDA